MIYILIVLNLMVLILIYAIEPYIWLKSMSTLGWKSHNQKKSFALIFLGYYILTLTKQFVVLNEISDYLNTLLIILMTFYIIWGTISQFNGTMQKKLLSSGMFFLSIYISELLGIFLFIGCFHISANILFKFGWLNCICTFLTKIIMYVICYFFFMNKKKNIIILLYGSIQLLPLIILTVILEIMVFSTAINFDFVNDSIQVLLLFLFTQVSLIFIVFYIGHILWEKKKELFQVEEELEHKKKIIELSNKLDDLRHDMSFHVSMIKSLVHKKKYEEMENYINRAFSDVEIAEDMFDLSNPSVSITLSKAAKEAREKEIRFSHIVTVQDFIIDSHEICSLLSNIMKNAIEASEKVEQAKRFICLEISSVKEGYRISCMNSYAVKAAYQDGKWITTKKDFRNHGRGLKIIKDIVKKYRGIVSTEFQDDFFEINCIIRNKGGKKQHYG